MSKKIECKCFNRYNNNVRGFYNISNDACYKKRGCQYMSIKTIEKVKEIERQAEALEREYDNQLQDLKKATASKIAQLEEAYQTEINKFKALELEKLEDKLQTLQNTIQQEEVEQIKQLESRFSKKEQELVEEVVKEVMRRYGNS